MARKTWIKLKVGLSADPKHRQQMGMAVWLFFHMLNIADWETGIIWDWTDAGAAEEMEMEQRTVRAQRVKLEEHGYIECERKQHGLRIKIMKWVNPREYSGKVYNTQATYGGTKNGPDWQDPASLDSQSDIQSDIQIYTKSVTPTLNPHTTYHSNKNRPDPLVEVWEKALTGAGVADGTGRMPSGVSKILFDLATLYATPLSLEAGVFSVGLPDAEACALAESRLTSTLQRSLAGICNQNITLRFVSLEEGS